MNFVGNLAVDGATTQSSTSTGNWFSERAIDGNRGLQQMLTGCSSTLNETNPWWRLDLRHIYRVSEVVITNRNDCCAERINGAEIRIGNSLENEGNNNPMWEAWGWKYMRHWAQMWSTDADMTVFLYPSCVSLSVDVLLFLLFQQVSPTGTHVVRWRDVTWIWSFLETWRHSLCVRWRSMEKVWRQCLFLSTRRICFN